MPDHSEQLDLPDDPSDDPAQDDLEALRQSVLDDVGASRLNTLQQKVAWILSHYPDARDSDVGLYIRFWEQFESEYLEGEYVKLKNIYRLTRPGSLTRARAKLQNEFKLFVASPEVRRKRGTLSEEEKELALAQKPRAPMYSVYVDESGKTDDHLVVGGVWFLNGPEIITIDREARAILAAGGLGELHFKEITDAVLPHYMAVGELIVQHLSTLSFTSISVERRGHKNIDAVLVTLLYHLLLRGVEHHHGTGRAPLPRALTAFKDLEEVGRDKLALAEVKERLLQASDARLDGLLLPDTFAPMNSFQNVPIQIADLYTSSVARVLNATGARSSARDRFADWFLSRLGQPGGPKGEEKVGDISVHVVL